MLVRHLSRGAKGNVMDDELQKIRVALLTWGAVQFLELDRRLNAASLNVKLGNAPCTNRDEIFTWSNRVSRDQQTSEPEQYRNYLILCAFAVHHMAGSELQIKNHAEAIPLLREVDYLLSVADKNIHEAAWLKEAKTALAKIGGAARLTNNPEQAAKQEAKSFVFQCWQDWQKSKTPENPKGTYSGKAAFARDMLDKCEELKSQPVIESWCREWESTQAATTEVRNGI